MALWLCDLRANHINISISISINRMFMRGTSKPVRVQVPGAGAHKKYLMCLGRGASGRRASAECVSLIATKRTQPSAFGATSVNALSGSGLARLHFLSEPRRP